MRRLVFIPGIVFGLLVFGLMFTLGIGIKFGLDFAGQFSHAAQEPTLVLIQRFWPYLTSNFVPINQPQTYLLLGLDSLQTRGDQPPLTDTIMLLKIWPARNKLLALSLPRDLYIETEREKINALYAAGIKKQAQDPSFDPKSAVTATIADLTQTKIDRTVIFTLDDVSELVDAMGGLRVEVETGFKDELFPRPEVDVTQVTDPRLLYKTVEFTAGTQLMSGERVLEYVRSRHSNGPEGNDLARNKRQQQVMAALITQLSQSQTLSSPLVLGKLYRLYHQKFESQLQPEYLLALLVGLSQNRRVPTLDRAGLTIYPDDPQGVIYHPPESKYGGAWVFVIKDMVQFHNLIAHTLEL